jgi:ferrochelatase
VTPPAASKQGENAPVGVLLMAHGTPDDLQHLEAFYTEIRRGRPPAPDQLEDLRARYVAIGGTSPLNQRTAAQVSGVQRALDAQGGGYVVAYGAKHAEPRIPHALDQLLDAGVRRVLGLVLAPHYSAMSIGEYTRLATEAAAAAGHPLELDVVKDWYQAEGFPELLAQRVINARANLPHDVQETATVVFTAHSLPARILDTGDPYPRQVEDSARLVAAHVGLRTWRVAFQSAGATSEPWLGPDIRTLIGELAAEGATAVIVCPIGFVSDHLEVLFDLDIQASQEAQALGLPFTRTASLNDDPEFCNVLARLIGSTQP